MTEYDFLISERNTAYTIYSGTTNQKIKIRYKEQNVIDSITVEVNKKEPLFNVQLHNGSVVVEGKEIKVKSTSLPKGEILTLRIEPLEQEQYEFRWEVKSGTEHQIYSGVTDQAIMIYGPDNQKSEDEKSKVKEQHKILVITELGTSEPVVPGSSTLARGSWIAIKDDTNIGNAWTTGKYILQ